MIRKYLEIKRGDQEQTKEKNKLSFVASTASVDRYGDIVVQNWDLEAYKSNPIILFNHDQTALPIGKGVPSIKDNQLNIDIEFDLDDPQAAEIARKAKKGFLNAVSVGFQPLEFIPRSELSKEDPRHSDIGNLFTKSELLEVSIVTIPAQSEAVAISKSGFGEFRDVLKEWTGKKSKTRFIASLRKHILRVEETEDRYIVHFKKEEGIEEEIEEEIEELEEEFLDEFIKAKEDDEDEEAEEEAEDGEEYEEEDEDGEKDEDEKKAFNLALLRALTSI
jgi:HK97 family phage prohead protease